MIRHVVSAIVLFCVSYCCQAAAPAVFAIYMPGLTKYRGPGWPGAVDKTRLPITGNRTNDILTEVDAAIAAGIDGFIFAPTVNTSDAARQKQLDEYEGFLGIVRRRNFTAPFMMDCNTGAVHTPEDVRSMARMWFSRFANAEVPRKNGSPIIMTYQADDQKPEFWRELFAELAGKGYRGHWLAHLKPIRAQADGSLSPAHAALARSYIDAGFSGIADSGINIYAHQYSNLIRAYKEAGGEGLETIMVSPWPEYWRTQYSILIPPDGTALLRATWESVLAGGATMFDLYSWNDFSEEHQIAPSLLKSTIRSDITRYYTAQFKGTAVVFPGSRVYLSYRKSLPLGESICVEVLGMPCEAASSPVSVELRNPDGSVIRKGEDVVLSGAAMEAKRLVFSPRDFDPARVVHIYAALGKNGVMRYIDFIRLIPGISEDHTTVSHLLSAMHDAPTIAVKGSVLSASSVKGASRIQILRNSDEAVASSPSGALSVPAGMQRMRLRIVLSEPPPAAPRGSLCFEDGVVLRVNNAHSHGVPPQLLSISNSNCVIFALPQAGNFYHGGFFVDAAMRDTGRVVFQLDGGPAITWSRVDVEEKRILASSYDKIKMIMLLVGGERLYDESADGVASMAVIDTASLPKGCANDVYYARSFSPVGEWANSTPIFSASEAAHGMPVIDTMSGERYETKVSDDEALMLSYDFNETPSDLFLVRDSSVRGLHTVLASGAFLLTGSTGAMYAGNSSMEPVRTNGALVFDGIDDVLAMPNCVPAVSYTVDMSVTVSAFDVERTLFTDRRYGGAHGKLCIRVQADGKVKVSCKTMSQWFDFTSDRSVPANKGSRITVVNDAKNITMYIDGAAAGSMPYPGADTRPIFSCVGKEIDGSGYVGAQGASQPFKGSVHSIRIHCVPLPPR
ncbi:MAG: LamG-like jellyroll fold domain-containing protein [Spirochaetota bacterium]